MSVTLYHYTDYASWQSIAQSKVIMKSTESFRDAFFGEGVYLTRLIPSNGKGVIAQNNFLSGMISAHNDVECLHVSH